MLRKRGREQAIRIGRKCVSKRGNSCIDKLIFTQQRKCDSVVKTLKLKHKLIKELQIPRIFSVYAQRSRQN